MSDQPPVEDLLPSILARLGALVVEVRALDPELALVKPPHEFAGVVRLLWAAPDRGLVGLDVYRQGLDEMRIWRQVAGEEEAEVVDATSSIDWAGLDLGRVAHRVRSALAGRPRDLVGDRAREIADEALGRGGRRVDATSALDAALLAVALASEAFAFARRLAGTDGPPADAVGQMMVLLDDLAPDAVAGMRVDLDRALRHLVEANLDSPDVLAEVEGHEVLRQVAGANPLRGVAFSPLLDPSMDPVVRQTFPHLLMGGPRTGLAQVTALHRWLRSQSRLIDSLLLPALTSGRWTDSDEEATANAELAATLAVVGEASDVFGPPRDPPADFYARALFLCSSPEPTGPAAVARSAQVLAELRRDVLATATALVGGSVHPSTDDDPLGGAPLGDDARRLYLLERRYRSERDRRLHSAARYREAVERVLPFVSARVAEAVEPIDEQGVADLAADLLVQAAVDSFMSDWWPDDDEP